MKTIRRAIFALFAMLWGMAHANPIYDPPTSTVGAIHNFAGFCSPASLVSGTCVGVGSVTSTVTLSDYLGTGDFRLTSVGSPSGYAFLSAGARSVGLSIAGPSVSWSFQFDGFKSLVMPVSGCNPFGGTCAFDSMTGTISATTPVSAAFGNQAFFPEFAFTGAGDLVGPHGGGLDAHLTFTASGVSGPVGSMLFSEDGWTKQVAHVVPTPIPEPATLLLALAGLVALALWRRRPTGVLVSSRRSRLSA